MSTVPESDSTKPEPRKASLMESPASRADVIVPIALIIVTFIVIIFLLISEVYILKHAV